MLWKVRNSKNFSSLVESSVEPELSQKRSKLPVGVHNFYNKVKCRRLQRQLLCG